MPTWVTWLYASCYFEREYNTRIWEDDTFECPHCGYVVYKNDYPCEHLCPRCGANK